MSRPRALWSAIILAASTAMGTPSAASDSPFPVRMVKSGASMSDPALRPHVEFSARAGFNAVWVHSYHAGRWTARAAPEGPYLHPEFVSFAEWCRSRGLRLYVSLNPVADSGGSFVFRERDGARRIRRFYRLLRRQAGVRDFVLSFDDQPTRLYELGDLFRYGGSSAPAHLDLAVRVGRSIRRDESFWLTAAAYSDVHLGDGSGPYSSAFLEGLAALPRRVGIVWTGPTVISPSITLQDMQATRQRLGGRRILLYDNFPASEGGTRDALALILAPLRRRDPRLHEAVSVYLACPMGHLGASRLPLMTVADYLADPAGYDPDRSWSRAMDRLAGDDGDARSALRVQGLEWGGWIDERNYLPGWEENPERVAARLDDPAYVSLFTWTVDRYPDRMRALEGLSDEWFRRDVLDVMARRLAVARAVPVVIEIRRRIADGRDDLEPLYDTLRAQRAALVEGSSALRILDAFLLDAAMPAEVLGPPRPAEGR